MVWPVMYTALLFVSLRCILSLYASLLEMKFPKIPGPACVLSPLRKVTFTDIPNPPDSFALLC